MRGTAVIVSSILAINYKANRVICQLGDKKVIYSAKITNFIVKLEKSALVITMVEFRNFNKQKSE